MSCSPLKIHPHCRFAVHIIAVIGNVLLFLAFVAIFTSHVYLLAKLYRNQSMILILNSGLIFVPLRFASILIVSTMAAWFHLLAAIRLIKYFFAQFRSITKYEALKSYFYCFFTAYLLIFCSYSLKNLPKEFENGFKQAIRTYNYSSVAREAIDQVQKSYQCCGLIHGQDYYILSRMGKEFLGFALCNTTSTSSCLPTSCCRSNDCHLTSINKTTFNETLYDAGCGKAFRQDHNVWLFAPIVLAIFLVLQIISALLMNVSYSAYALSDGLKFETGKSVQYFLMPWPNVEAYVKRRYRIMRETCISAETLAREEEFSRKRQKLYQKLRESATSREKNSNEEANK
ncbi:unnamed protein product, partial [Mesorhabditis belari]|uniref:Tetraspanin n=1 Tax=Mesorhabditis belari TaxID=2138241 RepID=A0AAF3F8P5_9BILA